MSARRGWDIHTRTQAISVGPALVLTLLLISFFTFVRLQDLRQELDHTGQLIANQLAPATEYGVISGNREVLDSLLRATLTTPHVRFLEVQDSANKVLIYVGDTLGTTENATPQAPPAKIFQAPIRLQRIELNNDFLEGSALSATAGGAMPAPSTNLDNSSVGEDYLGRVIVGMSNDALNERQQEILFKAAVLALFALMFTFLLARRLARNLAQPISAMGNAVKAMQSGDYHTPLPVPEDAELGDLARHINKLADGLETASREQQVAIAQLIKTREEAEQANSAKSDFLAMMSHELRTPMNGVLGMLQLLETTEMTQEQAEYSSLATESTEHLLKVINDILDFSRIERGALEMEHIPFNPSDLLQSSALAFQHSAQQRGLQLSLETQPGLEQLQVLGDPTRIRQILVNLIGNALKFTEEGRIRIQTHWQTTEQPLIWLTCTVSDSGIGISPERLEHMFDAFQQADSSISRRYGGTGLGLPIARTLAERMGGTLRAQSIEGEGSTFILEIPLALRLQGTLLQSTRAVGPDNHSKQIVLLVEDNPVNQTVIEAMLRSLGYQSRVVNDGVQAVQIAEQESFAAILMDCRLPTMDGYEATRRIRQLPGYATLPIIALTANALPGDRATCLQAGMNDYLSKPFKRIDLQRILQLWLRQ